ncbi:MAG: hypothetical protein AAF493_07675 [Pseudomonadota bacterium]
MSTSVSELNKETRALLTSVGLDPLGDGRGTQTTPPSAVDIVFPPDGRKKIVNTTVFPYSSIGLLEMKFPNHKEYTGTGVMIGDRLVLTAAHNLYDESDGGRALTVTFSAGRNGPTSPYGCTTAENFWYPTQWEESKLVAPRHMQDFLPATDVSGARKFDYGLVALEAPPHEGEGYLGFSTEIDQVLESIDVNVTGYPGDKPPNTMWGQSGRLSAVLDDFLLYRLSSARGESGAGVMGRIPQAKEALTILGVHIGFTEYEGARFNLGVRINKAVVDQILDWIAEWINHKNAPAR